MKPEASPCFYNQDHEGACLRHVENIGPRSPGPDHPQRSAQAWFWRCRRRAPGQILRALARRSLTAEAARAEVERIAREVLTNPVIEEFSYRIED